MSENIVLGFTNPDYDNIRVLNKLGGTGDVFAAHKKGMNIEVVIKRTQLQYQHQINQENESTILKSLKHQYLPRIYDVLYGNDGCIYTVMDRISGENLQQYVQKNGPVTQKECYRWACQLCEVVQYLHQENSEKPAIIHCDIKPGNVMITGSGDICLIDFNTSLIFRRDKKSVAVTDGYAAPEQYASAENGSADAAPRPSAVPAANGGNAGLTMPMDGTVPMGGTVPMDETVPMPAAQSGATVPMDGQWKMPQQDTEIMPEQQTPAPMPRQDTAAPGSYGEISMATDIYAIGATLYFAVTGHNPEKSLDTVTPLEQYKPKISRSMQTIIVRAMQKQQQKRFQQASEMLRALKNIDKMDQGYKSCQMRKRIIALALAACFAASAYSCYYGLGRMQSERENLYLLNLAQADQAEQSADYDKARALLEEAVQQQPGRPDAYLQMAVLLYRTGNYQGAIDQLDSAVASGNLAEKNMDSISVEKLHYIKGNCYIELQDYDHAAQELQLAVQQQGASTDSYRSLAIALANAGKLEQAQKTLEVLQKNGASSGDCDLVAAEIKSLQKQYEQAITLYRKVFDEVEDTQLLSHAYLAAANAALNMDDAASAEQILEQGCEVLPEGQAVLQKEMLADIALKQAASDKANAKAYYEKAEQRLQELVDSGYATIATKLNLATVLQALDQYGEAESLLKELAEQYPTDYRFEMQRAYLLIDWQGTKPSEKRDYREAEKCYDSAVEKYKQAQANGTEDTQMAVLKNLMDQLRTSGWLK